MRKQRILFLAVAIFLVAFTLSLFQTCTAAGVENTWTKLAPMPTATSVAGVGVVGGRIYVIGGSAMSGVIGTNQMYDPATDTWTIKAPMPSLVPVTTSVYGGKIYCFSSGLNQVYDPETDSWAYKTPSSIRRSVASACVVNGKIYLLGGFDPNSLDGLARSNVNEMYDVNTDSWTLMAPIPVATVSGVSAVLNNKIYLIRKLASTTKLFRFMTLKRTRGVQVQLDHIQLIIT